MSRFGLALVLQCQAQPRLAGASCRLSRLPYAGALEGALERLPLALPKRLRNVSRLYRPKTLHSPKLEAANPTGTAARAQVRQPDQEGVRKGLPGGGPFHYARMYWCAHTYTCTHVPPSPPGRRQRPGRSQTHVADMASTDCLTAAKVGSAHPFVVRLVRRRWPHEGI